MYKFQEICKKDPITVLILDICRQFFVPEIIPKKHYRVEIYTA